MAVRGSKTQYIKVSDVLIGRGIIVEEIVRSAEEEARSSGITVEKYLVDNELVPQELVAPWATS